MDKQNKYDFVPVYKESINCIKCPKDAVEKAIDKVLKEFEEFDKKYVELKILSADYPLAVSNPFTVAIATENSFSFNWSTIALN